MQPAPVAPMWLYGTNWGPTPEFTPFLPAQGLSNTLDIFEIHFTCTFLSRVTHSAPPSPQIHICHFCAIDIVRAKTHCMRCTQMTFISNGSLIEIVLYYRYDIGLCQSYRLNYSPKEAHRWLTRLNSVSLTSEALPSIQAEKLESNFSAILAGIKVGYLFRLRSHVFIFVVDDFLISLQYTLHGCCTYSTSYPIQQFHRRSKLDRQSFLNMLNKWYITF